MNTLGVPTESAEGQRRLAALEAGTTVAFLGYLIENGGGWMIAPAAVAGSLAVYHGLKSISLDQEK